MSETYAGKALDFLKKFNLQEGDTIELTKNGVILKGIIMPSYSSSDDILVIKLDNGYNIGISVDSISEVKLIKRGEKERRKGKRRKRLKTRVKLL